MLKIALLAGAVVVGGVLLVVVIGLLLPKSHVAARCIAIHHPPEEVFRLISDVKAAPAWRPDVQNVELLGIVNGQHSLPRKGQKRRAHDGSRGVEFTIAYGHTNC